MSPTSTDYLHYTWQMLNGFRTKGEQRVAAERQQDIAPYLGANRRLQVLDLGNGRLRPQYTLLRAAGHESHSAEPRFLIGASIWPAREIWQSRFKK